MSSETAASTMKQEATIALEPKLRFPEFHGAALRSVLLGDVTEECRSRNGSKHSAASVMGVTKAEGIVPMETRLIASDIARYKLVETDWFAYNPMRLNIGSIARWEGEQEILVSPDYVVFKCITNNEPGCTPSYLDQFRQTKAWVQFVTEGGDGSVRVRIYYKDIARIGLALPPLSEQHKIADCLSSLDELISAQAHKVDALKTHKQGLMQKLFPCEGETQPRLRFPDFRNSGEWEETELGQCLEKLIDYRGKPPPKAESGVPLITAKNVRFGWLDMTNDEYIEEGAYDSWMTKGIPAFGDILFTTEAPLGNVAMFPSKGTYSLGQRIITLRCKIKQCIPEFLFQSLLGPVMQERIDFHSTGSTAKGIKSSVFVTLAFRHPKVPEQQRIAECLSSLDALIIATSQKLEALKTHKKGLMQQFFPSLEAASP